MSLVLNGTTGITNLPSINSGQIANRNAVQNGAMMVDQKGGTTTLSGYSAAKPDRFTAFVSNAGTQTVAQDSEAPAGFHKSLKATKSNPFRSKVFNCDFDFKLELMYFGTCICR